MQELRRKLGDGPLSRKSSRPGRMTSDLLLMLDDVAEVAILNVYPISKLGLLCVVLS